MRLGKPIVKTAVILSLSLISLNVFAGNNKTDANKILQQAPNLKAKALKSALKAYEKVHQKGLDKKPILTVIDFTMPSNEKRLWVIDLNTNQILENDLVAHGKGSGFLYAKHFSNYHETYASSLGVYLTGDTYYGKHGLSLRLYGLEKGINDNALDRTIVMHGAHYVSPEFVKTHGYTGRSWGCPALNQTTAAKVIPAIKDGSIVVAYHDEWQQQSDLS